MKLVICILIGMALSVVITDLLQLNDTGAFLVGIGIGFVSWGIGVAWQEE